MDISLTSLSNEELVSRLTASVAVEKKTNHDVVLHLAEVERRQLYLPLGYNSLFDYTVSGLGYSESAAWRRINAARMISHYPEVKRSLDEGKVTLTTIQRLSGVITPANAKELLCKVESGQHTIARVVAEYKPVGRQGLKDRIVPVTAKKENKDQGSLLNLMENLVTSTANALENTQERDLYRINVTADEELKQMLDRMKELTGNAPLATILKRACGSYLKQHCPKERRKRREARKSAPTKKPAKAAPVAIVKPENSRYVPVALKEKVLKRDNYRCTYVGADGVRCQAKACLEIDHCQPYAVGGKTEYENLRTLCRAHNLFQARVAFGAAQIDEKIAARRKVSVRPSTPHRG